MSSDIEIHQCIDTSGTRCPLPLLKAKQALKLLKVGENLKVLATDPSAKPDFDAMLKHLPHELIHYEKCELNNGEYARVDTFIIRKG